MTRHEALQAAIEAGYADPGSMGGPGHRYGCRLFGADDYLIGSGPTWADAVDDMRSAIARGDEVPR